MYKVLNTYYQYLLVTALFITDVGSFNHGVKGNAGSEIALLSPIISDHEED